MATFPRAFSPAVDAAGERTPRRALLPRLVQNRMVQFLLIGAPLFLVSRSRQGETTVALSRQEIGGLSEIEGNRRKVRPESVQGDVLERSIEDEILYREGIKLGFDRNDAIVRQRVIQKTLFLAEELAGASEPPTADELRAFYEATRSEWVRPERFALTQILFHEKAAAERALPIAEAGGDLSRLGDPSPLPRAATLSAAQLASAFGKDFVEGLAGAPVGSFGPPIRSALGWHLVRVDRHDPPTEASFEEVRSTLPGTFVARRREAAVAAYLEKTFKTYRVTLDGEAVEDIHPRGRVALRSAGSAED